MKKVFIEKISVHSWFNVSEADYPYETYEFNIDFKNNNAYFDEKKIYEHCIEDMLNKENKNAFSNIHNFYSEELFSLDNTKISKLISSVNTLKKYYEENPSTDTNLAHPVFYTITITYHNQGEDYLKVYNEFPLVLFDFANVLKQIVGFDVFNLDNLKYLVTEHDYNIAENKIQDKITGEELILKKIDYSKECGALFTSTTTSFHIDFNKEELIDSDDNKINLSSEDIKKILFLVKKYGIFKWNSIEYSNKAINEYTAVLDGCTWRLSLAFAGGQVLNCGGHHNYQDTYVEFGKELLDLFGIDLLDIANL